MRPSNELPFFLSEGFIGYIALGTAMLGIILSGIPWPWQMLLVLGLAFEGWRIQKRQTRSQKEALSRSIILQEDGQMLVISARTRTLISHQSSGYLNPWGLRLLGRHQTLFISKRLLGSESRFRRLRREILHLQDPFPGPELNAVRRSL